MYKLSIREKWYAKLDHICGIYNIYTLVYISEYDYLV
jgi:hypothetical protein